MSSFFGKPLSQLQNPAWAGPPWGNPDLPLVVGCIAGGPVEGRAEPLADVQLDGQQVVLRAVQSLVLRCGKASITLNEDGAIEIRGVNLVSRALGRNRIFGGSIDLN